MKTKIIIAVLFCCGICGVGQAGEPLGLTLGPNRTVLKDGKPYRGVGMTYYDCFDRTLQRNTDTSYEEGFRVLAKYHIPFVRCSFSGSTVKNMRLYQENRAAYFRLMDAVVHCAEINGVGLIPSLFFSAKTVTPQMMNEHGDQWANTNSRTIAFMRQYTHEVVSRYKNSPAIWAWEFCNEYNSYADFPRMAKEMAKHKNPKFPDPRDYPKHDIMIVAFREFALAVRRDDPYRLIESGADFPKPTAWHYYKEHNFLKDTPQQFEFMLGLNAVDPMNLICVHCYQDNGSDNFRRLDDAAVAARNLGKPLFVGEFQYPLKYGPASPEARKSMEDFLARLDRLQVPLAALWVFDYSPQEKDRNVTATNQRAWELSLLREHNERLAGGR
ncbi:MAG: cellulase family glycosylhydrolase [Verrucomicrobiales bacterium]|nr:cellulase family glycosylhydrolase [Verrucomicrobiales bacterium]